MRVNSIPIQLAADLRFQESDQLVNQQSRDRVLTGGRNLLRCELGARGAGVAGSAPILAPSTASKTATSETAAGASDRSSAAEDEYAASSIPSAAESGSARPAGAV